MKTTKKRRLTTFGNFYSQMTRLEKRAFLAEMIAAGISEGTVRSWMYDSRVPRPETITIVEQITGKAAAALFPY